MAIRIQKYQEQIGYETTNLPEVPHIQAVEGAFGGDVARGTQAIGKAVGDVAQVLQKHAVEQRQLQNDAFVASIDSEHTKAMQDALSDPTPETTIINGQKVTRPKGYLGRSGLNSIGSLGDFEKWHDTKAKSILDNIKDPATRLRVAKNIDSQYLSARGKVMEHEARETRSGYIKELESNRDLKISSTFNVSDVGKSLDEIAVLQNKINNAQGLDGATSQVELRKAVGSFVKNMVDTTLQADPTGDSSRALLANLSGRLGDDDNVQMNKYIDGEVKKNATVLLDDLNSKFIDGTITLEDIQSANRPKEKGGIGSASAMKMLKDLSKAQTDTLQNIINNSESAEKYVETVGAVLVNPTDRYKAKQILVNAMSDGVMSRDEAQKIDRLGSLLEKQKVSREDNRLSNGFGILKNWLGANETDNREVASALSNYLTYLDAGDSPEKATDKVLKDQYNKLNPQAPLGEDDKVFDPKREREISFVPVERFLKGVVRGGAGTVESFGAGLEWLGAKEAGKAFEEWGKTAREFYQVEDPTFVDQVAEGFGSTMIFFLPGTGIAKGASLLKVAPIIAKGFGIGLSSTLEAMVEGGDAYKNAIENGYGQKSASLTATSVFWGNLPSLWLSNKLGLFGDKGPKIMQVLISGAMEGGQEFTQALIQNIAASDPIAWDNAFKSAAIGTITGTGIKAAETTTQTLDELGVAKEFLDDLKLRTVKLNSERGSVVNPFGGEEKQGNDGQEPININPKDIDDVAQKNKKMDDVLKAEKKAEAEWADAEANDKPIEPSNEPSQFEGFTDKKLVQELSELVSNFEPGQTIIDDEGNYSRLKSGFAPGFTNAGYTQKYLQNIYSKYVAGEKLTDKQSEDLVHTLNLFKEMVGIKTSETIPDIVTAETIKQSKANQAIVRQIGKMLEKQVPASKVKSIIRESTGQVKDQGGQVSERTAFLQSLKDRVKAAKQAENFTREQIFDTQSDLIDLINKSDLEATDKARFLPMIKNVQTAKDLKKALEGHTNKKTGEVTPGLEERINNLINKEERRQVVRDIKKGVERAKNSKSIAVDYVNTIEQMVNDVDLKNRKPETLDRIQKMKDFLDSKITAGQDVTVTKDMLKDLKILEKKKFEDLSVEDLQGLLKSIEKAVQLGETKLGALQATRQTRKENMLNELVKGSKPIESKEVTRPKVGQRLNAGEKFKNSMSEAYNKAQEKDLAITPMDVVFDVLDGNKNYKGPNYKIFKETVDKAYSKYLTKVDNIVESVRTLANELKLDDVALERIGFYAAKVQAGGVEKLTAMGYTQQEIDAVVLTVDENKLYTLMRQKLDELRPDIQEVMRIAYNKDLDVVEDYFPFMTDFEAMSDKELRDRFGDSVELFGQAKRKNVEKGFTIKRTGGKQKIKLNALEVFYNHIDNAAYMIELGPTIKDLGDIAETTQYGEAVGEIGQERVREWIDLLARKGGVSSRRIRLLDTVRKNVGVATLGFKLSSALIQPTALLDGASIIGPRAFQGAYNVATDRDWRVFLKENFPELRARGADDPAYLEFGGNELIDKAGRAGFWALRNIDMLTASAITAGAYQMSVEEKGEQVDFSKPDQEAIVEAQRILRRTQASAFPKDLPSAISQGGLTGNVSVDKLMLQFQTFMINRWSIIRHDMWSAGIKEGEYGKAFNIFFFLAMANFAEIGVRRFSKELLAQFTNEKLEDWPETFSKEIVMAGLGNVPFVSQTVSAVNYGSIPVPSIDMTKRIIDRMNGAATAKTQSTRDKNLVRGLTLALGVLFKIPGTVQGEQIVKHMVGGDRKRSALRPDF